MNWAYVYDLRSQIRSVAGTVDGVLWGGSYQYRKDGNIDRQTVQGAQTVFGYSGDRMTQRGQQDLGWDGNGQLTSDEVRTLAWTWDGQLRSATNAGGEIRCRYDPDGNRIRREVQATGQPTQARKYIVDAEGDVPQVLLEINPAIEDPNLAIIRTFLYADAQLVAFHDGFFGDSLYFAMSDQHGSVRQVMDESGTVVSGYAYDPWGSPLAAPAFEDVAQPIRYAGYWWDAELARYYCWARYYDPLLERFLSRDPERGSFTEPFELHRYLYCLNDPINRIDPTGEMAEMVLRKADLTRVLCGKALAGLVVLSLTGYYIAMDATVSSYQGGYDDYLNLGSAVRNLLDSSIALFASAQTKQARKHIQGQMNSVEKHVEKMSGKDPGDPNNKDWLMHIRKALRNIKKYAGRLKGQEKDDALQYIDDITKQLDDLAKKHNVPFDI